MNESEMQDTWVIHGCSVIRLFVGIGLFVVTYEQP